MIRLCKLFLALAVFPIALNAQNELPHMYSQIVEKLVFYKKDKFKVFYGGPIDRMGKGAQWMMSITFEDNWNKTRAVYEVAFVNCDIYNATDAEVLFLEVSDINIKFKNTLTKDYEVFSDLLAGKYKEGKYVVIRSADVANVYYPDIFVDSTDGKRLELDKIEITKFLSEHLKTSTVCRNFYIGNNVEHIFFENEQEIIYRPIPVRISIENMEYSFLIEKRIRKKDIWKVYYIISESKKTLKSDDQVLIRLDSGCVSGQVYGDQSCDCLDQLHHALHELIKSNGTAGFVIHIPAHDGRGFGSAPKAETEIYKRGGRGRVNSTESLNTVEAAKILYGVDNVYDIRTYDGVAEILKEMNINEVVLLTDNVKKVHTLEQHGIKVFRQKTGTSKDSCLDHINAKKNDPMYFSE